MKNGRKRTTRIGRRVPNKRAKAQKKKKRRHFEENYSEDWPMEHEYLDNEDREAW